MAAGLRKCQLKHDAGFALQASQTTAQGLWLALGCGVIVGAAINVGGPFAVAGSPLCILSAQVVYSMQHMSSGICLYNTVV